MKCYECNSFCNKRYVDKLRFSDIIYYSCKSQACGLLQHERIEVPDRMKVK